MMKGDVKRTLGAGAALALMLGWAGAAQAGGFYLQEQSVRAVGRAFSGEVADTGAASLWWNPAAIAGTTHISGALGAAAIMPRGRVVDTGTLIVRPGPTPAPVGGDPSIRNPIDSGIAPSGAVAVPITDRIALGLALTSPYSFTTNYPADSWTRYSADRTKLRTIDIQPGIAVAVADWLRVGAALNIEHADATLSNALPNLAPPFADGEETLKGKGWDMGWSAGVQAHGGRFTLGASYKSSIRHTLKGTVEVAGLTAPLAAQNFSARTRARFRTPWQAMVGLRFAATPRLTLDAQVVRTGWKKFDAIRLGAPIDQAVPENYRNTWSYAVGADYALTPQWTVRAGVQHDQTPTRTSAQGQGARDARVPDSNRWNFAAGASWQVTPAIAIDAAASYVDFKNAAINRPTGFYLGTPAQTLVSTSGELRGAHAVVLALGARFGL